MAPLFELCCHLLYETNLEGPSHSVRNNETYALGAPLTCLLAAFELRCQVPHLPPLEHNARERD